MLRHAFDNDKYIKDQSLHILERIKVFGSKLYLEFGGKLFDDAHASRVLSGFKPDAKLQMLLKLKNEAEIVICINANDIESNKKRGDYGIGYDMEVLRLIDAFRGVDLYVGSVVVTQYDNQATANKFLQSLEAKGIKTYRHYPIESYPHNLSLIVSEDGFGKNDYIVTQKPLVVVTAPGPGSGKMATCLSQLYHDHKNNIKAGYAKFETFPIWNLSLQHPVNIAYEAATVDLNDMNMIDHYHLEAYGETAVNYNRDIEVFPVLKAMLERLMGECPYKSPTDMGVNRAGFCIIDDEAACKCSREEIVRRYYQSLVDYKEGRINKDLSEKLLLLVARANTDIKERTVVYEANHKAEQSNEQAFAMEMPDGKIITGRRTPLLGAPAACLLNALKYLAKIDDEIPLIAENLINPITEVKTKFLGNKNPRLHLDEVLIALALSTSINPLSKLAINKLKDLVYCEAHSTVILDPVDIKVLRKLSINVTCNPVYSNKSLYQKNII